MEGSGITVQCATYNAGLASGNLHIDYASWLVPTLSETSNDHPDNFCPDIYAIGFQESLPLHLSFLGFTSAVLESRSAEIREHLQKGCNTSYSLIKKTILGGTALFIFIKDDSEIASTIVDVSTSTAGIGPLWLVNKAAVGVRLTVKQQEKQVIYTFVCAHLAPHEHNVKARNNDWQSIVSRLLFEQPSGTQSPGETLATIYDTSYLFVFGDLNYRIDRKGPNPLSLERLMESIESDPEPLIEFDQLTRERVQGKTLHYLHEAPISFKPSYKFEPGTINTYSKIQKRTPSWCDRVLFATWADDTDDHGAIIKLYRSIMNVTASDHKPVTAIFKLPSIFQESLPVLGHSAPFPRDSLWKIKWSIGQTLSKIIGLVWTFIVLLGFGDGRIGSVNLILIACTTAVYGYWKGNI